MQFIKNLWRGDVSLPITFWVFGFGVNVAIKIAFYDAVTVTNNVRVIMALMLIFFAYAPFILIAIWRCANKYKGPKPYTVAVKILVMLGWVQYLASFGQLAKLGTP